VASCGVAVFKAKTNDVKLNGRLCPDIILDTVNLAPQMRKRMLNPVWNSESLRGEFKAGSRLRLLLFEF